MSATELLQALRSNGARLAVEGGELRIRAPMGVLTSGVRTDLSRNQDEILRSGQWAPVLRALNHTRSTASQW